MTIVAFTIVIVPFAVILGRLLFASGRHLYLPDDLALVDLHTRRALVWKQQLGAFDRFGWNHPGPAYFYLLSLAYRLLGSGARAMFFGATTINALAAVACVAVVRRRTTPARALWAAIVVCLLAVLLATVGPGSITYSEGALGALVSPWNPLIVILPLVLFVLLCAAAMDRSPLSLVGAALVGSFVIQTNISALPLVAALLAVSAIVWAVRAVRHRARTTVELPVGSTPTADSTDPSPGAGSPPFTRREWAWVAAGVLVFGLMWLPPFIQQLTNHPGNATLIYRFFTGSHQGQTLQESLWSLVAIGGTVVEGPSEVMSSILGNAPHHLGVSLLASGALVVIGVAVVAVAVAQRNRFATGLGALCLAGYAVMAVAVTGVVGFIFGYLVVWAVAVPFAALIGVGMVRLPSWAPGGGGRPITSAPWFRLLLCAAGLAVCVLLIVRVVMIPSLTTVSDTKVEGLVSLVVPALQPNQTVFVGDNGAGNGSTRFFDLEDFIGLVNWLDQSGYHPKVNAFWKTQFGPGTISSGREVRSVELSTWNPKSPGTPGYRGRVGDMAVVVTDANGRPAGG